jgi:hypothetical protein
MPRFIVIDSGGVARTITRLPVVDAGGTTRLIKRGFIIDAGGVARQFFAGDLTAEASPTLLSGSRVGAGFVQTVNQTTCTGTPPGGTFSWQFVSGDNTIAPTSAFTATTGFSTNISAGQTKQAVFRCQYTLGGDSVFSNNVSVTLQDINA